jgi:two-component system, NarL family, nitrate/nitrite response regulator NarL
MIRFIVADDDPVVHVYFNEIARRSEAIEIIGAAENGAEVIALAEKVRPDVILMDMWMPRPDGFEATKIIKEGFPEIKIILYSFDPTPRFMAECIHGGANGYFRKGISTAGLLYVMDSVHISGLYCDEETAGELNKIKGSATEKFRRQDLTQKEKQVLTLICAGNRNKEIAAALGITITTIDFHKRNITKKTGCRNAAQLALYAQENRLIR